MKNTIITLLLLILIVGIVNLLVGFGVLGGSGGGGGGDYEYKALNALQMDNIGFTAIAEEEGIEIGEDGKINFPKEMVETIAKVNLLPRTILEVEKDGGWQFVSVTADNHYIFRR